MRGEWVYDARNTLSAQISHETRATQHAKETYAHTII